MPSKRHRESTGASTESKRMPPPSKKTKEATNAAVENMEVGEGGEEGMIDRAPRFDLDVELDRGEDGAIRLGDLYIPPPPPPALTFDNDRPRLVITHIENENFKSYAGMQTLGPFHKSFSSIVGPNGSGKSNVIDSMLFVFGYRAQKIRSKKVSVLIHNSEQHQTVQSCTVRVYFQEIMDDCEDGTPVEGSQFNVARTAHRDNSSYYEINGKRVQFKEVAALLRSKGIDLDHNRFLILQGEVEQIAQMKPKGHASGDTGMLEYLEDIIGSSRFQEPIEILKNTVNELDELRGEKLSRVKLVEKEKDELEGPRNKAIAYLRMENEATEKTNLLYQYYLYDCAKEIKSIESKKTEFEKQSASIISKIEEIAKNRADLESSQKEAVGELEKLRKSLEEVQEQYKKHELEHDKIREEMMSVNARRKKLMTFQKNEQGKLEQAMSVPETNKTKIEECNELKVKLDAQVEEEQNKYDQALIAINKETQGLQEERDEKETKLIELKKDVNLRESDLRVAENELNLINSAEAKEKSRLDDLIMSKENAESKLKSLEKRKSELDQALPEKEKELNVIRKECKDLSGREESLFAKVRELQGLHDEKRAHMTAHKSKGRVIEALMEQKRTGQMPGIFGRLGDLGAIDKKYDVAISNAAGGQLDTILVDTVDTAKACIEFLRRNNVGRANFLALDKTKHFQSRVTNKPKTPENVHRLFDLVRPQDEKFSTAFYHYLRETLVANDIDQGQRIAFGATRYRVVTLAGEVIEVSGVMAGGGKEVLRGKMGTEIVRDDGGDDRNIKALEDQLTKAKEAHQICQEQKNEKELTLRKFEKEFITLSKEHQKVTLELKTLRDRFDDYDGQIQRQREIFEAAKPDPTKQKELQKRIEELTALKNEAKEKSDKVEFDVKKLNGKINEIRGSKLKSISKKLDDAKNQLDKVKKEINRLEVEIKTAERNVKKSQDKIEEYKEGITDAEQKLLEMKSKKDELEVKSKEVIQALEKLKKEEAEATENVEKINEKLVKAKKAEAETKSQQIEYNEMRDQFYSQLNEQNKVQAHWRRELKKLKLRPIPDEPVSELKTYELEEFEECDPNSLRQETLHLEEKLSSTKVNQAVIEEYRRKEMVYLERVGELEEISKRKDRQRKNLEELRKQRLNEFMEGFAIITSKLKEMYQMITLGGDAELELVDSLDPFAEGIVFSVRPPSKSWKNISNLSGGEKTLSSLALVFALHYYKPTPLYVMDEIDAALDFKNVSIVANYIKERTKNAQFIIISLRSEMFELADHLVGIYKTYDCTKSVTINPNFVATKAEEGKVAS